ncbi:hypothetical protein WICMUC_005010 [Wickerhamomyces mucosus]|uniref:C2H2-type domain-containing protein n=1 Tax=Wickerhamomyces mucosus TaxID=1378264 RepID=A0A9P8T8N0_9ASCO|nr:hypothetical protein WICMUC_005010 [Wickerhamomyces mucosus]
METSNSTFFKCNSCAIQFPNSDSQRYHMKTDWHRYNLKRRVAQLPPIDAQVFSEKLHQSKQYEQEVDEFGFKVLKTKESSRLHINNNKFKRGRPIDNSLIVDNNSIKRDDSPASVVSGLSQFSLGESVYSGNHYSHTDNESNFEETASEADTIDQEYIHETDSEDDEDESYLHDEAFEQEPLQPITSCIYCGLPHKEIEENVQHMWKSHGLFIPERSYLIDLKGLLEYLISIIVIDNECLSCNFRGRNLESIRAHIKSKGHSRLPFETKEEKLLFAKFYDFSSIDDEESKKFKKNSKKKVGFHDDEDQDMGDSEDDEQDTEGSNDDDDDDNGINDNYTIATVDPIDSQLTLPNGSRLGHRSLNRIYRQNIRIPLSPTQGQLTVSTADRRLVSGLGLNQYSKEERHTQLIETKQNSKKIQREVKRFNHQRHFRDPMLQ